MIYDTSIDHNTSNMNGPGGMCIKAQFSKNT